MNQGKHLEHLEPEEAETVKDARKVITISTKEDLLKLTGLCPSNIFSIITQHDLLLLESLFQSNIVLRVRILKDLSFHVTTHTTKMYRIASPYAHEVRQAVYGDGDSIAEAIQSFVASFSRSFNSDHPAPENLYYILTNGVPPEHIFMYQHSNCISLRVRVL